MTQPAPASTDPTPTPPTGATPPAPTPAPPATPPAAEPTADDKPLGPAGQKALAEEREARKALEAQVKALSPLAKLAEALGVDPSAKAGKSDVEALAERVAAQEKRAAEAELRALRLEVAAEKGLTAGQAARLQGGTRDELVADADELKALFPGAPGPSGTPAPDPTQGARGGVNELQARLAEAEKSGNAKEVIRLKVLIAAQNKK